MDAATVEIEEIEEVTEVTMKEEEAIEAEATTRATAAVVVSRTVTEGVATVAAMAINVAGIPRPESIYASHLSWRRNRLLHMETVPTDLQAWK